MNGQGNLAEKCADFIFTQLQKLGQNEVVNFDRNGNAEQAVPGNKRGIYLFFAKLSGKCYPVYLGKTETSFKARFYQHDVITEYKSGGIKKLFQTVNKDGEEVRLGALLVSLALPMIIKLTESLFLCAFNFALNRMENVATRSKFTDLDQTPNETISAGFFSPALDAMEKQSQEVVKKLRS